MSYQSRESCPMFCQGDPLSGMPVAMAYVPWQPAFHHTFDLCKALHEGTIFPDLCKPFCGKRGGCA